MASRLAQMPHVARVDDVEATVALDDRTPFTAGKLSPGKEFLSGDDLGGQLGRQRHASVIGQTGPHLPSKAVAQPERNAHFSPVEPEPTRVSYAAFVPEAEPQPGLIARAVDLVQVTLRGPDWLWLAGCVLPLWAIGVILGLDDTERLGLGYNPAAPAIASWGLAVGVASIWLWRRWLIRNHPARPAHDAATDVLLVLGAFGALGLYLLLVPGHKLLPPNRTLCTLSGVAGAALLASAWTRRVGNSFHCTRCGYEISDFSLPRRCPECEGIWAHRLVRGRIDRSVPLIALAVVLLFVLTLAPLPRLDASSPFIRGLTPTSWIVARATERLQSARSLEASWWRELSRRRLDETDAETLRELVLREQLSSRLLDSNAYAWLQGELFAGRGSMSQYRRFLEDAIAPTISIRGRGNVAATVATAGDTITVVPRIEESRRVPRERLAVYVEGIWKNDDTTPIVKSSRWELLSDLVASEEPLKPDNDSVRFGTSFPTFTRERLSFAGKFWIAVVTDGHAPTAMPRDMNRQLPANVPWLGEFDAHRQLEVLPPRTPAPRPEPTRSQSSDPRPKADGLSSGRP